MLKKMIGQKNIDSQSNLKDQKRTDIHQRKRGSVAKTIHKWVGIPMILSLIVLSIAVMYNVKNSLWSLSEEKMESKTLVVAEHVEQFFNEFEVTVQTMAQNEQLGRFIETLPRNTDVQQHEEFSDVMNTMKKVEKADSRTIAVWAASIKGNAAWTSNDFFIGGDSYDMSARAWYQAFKKDPYLDLVVTEPYYDDALQMQVVSVISSVKNSHGMVVGFVGVDASMDSVLQMMKNEKLGKEGFFVLLSGEDVIISHAAEEIVGKKLSEAPIDEAMKSKVEHHETGHVQFKEGKVTNRGYIANVGEREWMVISVLPLKEFTGAYNALQMILLIVFVITIAVVYTMITMVAKNISKPLRELKDSADLIASGNLDVNINTDADNEVGLVAESLAKTVTRLKEYIEYIQEISQSLDKIAQGDMRVRLTKEYHGEFGAIKTALQNISRSLNQTLSMIQDSSEQVNMGAGSVSSAAQSLASGATTQASAVQELTAQIDIVAQRSKENAEQAKIAREVSQISSENLQASGEYMSKMLTAMEDINRSSEEIHKIIKAIDDIAFQTNILALNAAVEAARAGEAGKGFAVVADEVRNLAARSAEAAKQTQALVEQSVRSANEGLGIAKDTADALERVQESEKKTSEIIDVIADASSEQANSIEQIDAGLSQVSTVIQSNAATAEESSAASEELSAQAEHLFAEVNKFILEDRY